MPNTEIIFKIPFDADTTRKQFMSKINSILKKPTESAWLSLIAALIIIFITSLMMQKPDPYVSFALGFSIMLAIASLNALLIYNRNRKVLKNNMEKFIAVRQDSNDTSHWEFRDSYFRIQDIQFDMSITWKAVELIKQTEDSVILYLTGSETGLFYISVSEIGLDLFNHLVPFLKDRSKAYQFIFTEVE